MSNLSNYSSLKSKIVNLIMVAVIILTAFQGIIPAMPLTNANTVTLISAITMFLVSGLTIWKQYFSDEIKNAAATPTIVIAILATIGSLNELFTVVHIGEITSQWIRFALTFITMALNIASKLMYPTFNTRSNF